MDDIEKKVSIMNKLEPLPNLPTPTCTGWWPMRTWVLRAEDKNKNELCSVSSWEDNNYLKYVVFINKLIDKGYKLTEKQRIYLKRDKNLGFMDAAYWLPKASKSDFIKIGKYAGFSESDYYIVKDKKTDTIRKLFAERLGLEFNELLESYNHF